MSVQKKRARILLVGIFRLTYVQYTATTVSRSRLSLSLQSTGWPKKK